MQGKNWRIGKGLAALAVLAMFGLNGCGNQPKCEGVEDLAVQLHDARRSIRGAERASDDLASMVVQEAPKVYVANTATYDAGLQDAVSSYLDRSGGDKKGVWSDSEVERLRSRRNEFVRTFEVARQEASEAVEGELTGTRNELEALAARLDGQEACGDVDLTELWNLVDETEDVRRGEYRWIKQARVEDTGAVVERAVAAWEKAQAERPVEPQPIDPGDPTVTPWERPAKECSTVGLLTGRRVQVEKYVLLVDHEDYTVCDPSQPGECDPDEAERQKVAADAVPALLDELKAQLEERNPDSSPRYHLIRTRVEDITTEWIESSVEASLEICDYMRDDATGQELVKLRNSLSVLLQVPSDESSASD